MTKPKFIKKLKNSSLTEEEQNIVYNDYLKRALETITDADIVAHIGREHMSLFQAQTMNTILNLSKCGKINKNTTPAQLLDAISECAVCNTPTTTRCSQCNMVRYCSRECQKQDWKKHKKICINLLA